MQLPEFYPFGYLLTRTRFLFSCQIRTRCDIVGGSVVLAPLLIPRGSEERKRENFLEVVLELKYVNRAETVQITYRRRWIP